MRFPIFVSFLMILGAFGANAAQTLDLNQALRIAYENNPAIAASQAQSNAERSAIRAQYAPENPMLGYQYSKNMTLMQMSEGPMRTWSLTQDLKFPLKYFVSASAQRARAEGAQEEANAKRLEIRRKVISTYYRLFSIERVLALLEANLHASREVARIAEARHSTGGSPQQDEMKAHVEETRVNADLLLAQEEREAVSTEFRSLLGQEADSASPSHLPAFKEELSIPELKVTPDKIPELARAHARRIKQSEFQLKEAQAMKNLARLGYTPDFRVMYRRAFGNTAPDSAYETSVELSLPLWFFVRQTSEVSSASSSVARAEHSLTQATLETRSLAKTLSVKVRNHETLLKIYKTSLVPQATSTLNSSQAAYRAGRVSILELLDSQRNLYNLRIAYYRTLVDYVDSVAELEEMAGASLSDLPFPKEI